MRNLVTCARDGGNYLFNIGPKADGSIPAPSVRILSKVGDWMQRNGEAIYGADICQVKRSQVANFTRRGKTLYVHVHFWPGSELAIGGLRGKIKSAHLLCNGQRVEFEQDRWRVRLYGLPNKAPDDPVTVLALECASEPRQDMEALRMGRKREGV